MAVERIARVIAESYGQDPDDYASLLDICGPNNEPLPIWHMYKEQAEAVVANLGLNADGRQFMQALVDEASAEKQKRKSAEARAQKLETALRAMLTNYGPPDSGAPLCQYPDWHPITQARRALALTTEPKGGASPVANYATTGDAIRPKGERE